MCLRRPYEVPTTVSARGNPRRRSGPKSGIRYGRKRIQPVRRLRTSAKRESTRTRRPAERESSPSGA
ncbi:hypothetical protein STTU_4047 [Streptomyces sp. Tu6071]|nr:hypothetical protein STTU_4047 [Streptomyces sp. Tu6071]